MQLNTQSFWQRTHRIARIWFATAWLVTVAAIAAPPATPPATSKGSYTPAASDIHAFYVAIAQNDLERVKNYLEQGFDPNASEGKKRVAPMFWAARRGTPEGMELLLKHGGNPNLKYHNDTALLAYVIGRGASLKNPSSDWSDQDEVQQEKLNDRLNTYHNLALLLLDYGADPNSRYELDRGKYFTALGMAAEMDDLELVKRLVDLGANVHEPKNTPFAPLFQAARNANVEIAKVLLEKGADVHAKVGSDPKDFEFLHHAVKSQNLEFALLPLQYGVTVDEYRSVYLMWSIPRALTWTAEAALKPYDFSFRHQLLDELLKRGMDVSKGGVFRAVYDGDLHAVKVLLTSGAQLCLRNEYQRTAYEEAVRDQSDADIIAYLETRGGDRCPQ